MGDPVRLPAFGKGQTPVPDKMSREEFQRWVKKLGAQKTYTKTPYVNQFGKETTFREELDFVRQVYATSPVEGQPELAKLSDAELLQHLRNIANRENGVMDLEWKKKDKNMQAALDKTPMS